MNHGLTAVVALTCAVGCAIGGSVGCQTVPPEKKAIADAAAALGGSGRIEAVRTVVIEGEGSAPNVGQNTMPDGDLPVWKVTEYKRTIDLASGRVRTQQTRTAQFQFANSPIQRQDQSLDGDVAYNTAPDGGATRPARRRCATDGSRRCTIPSPSCARPSTPPPESPTCVSRQANSWSTSPRLAATW